METVKAIIDIVLVVVLNLVLAFLMYLQAIPSSTAATISFIATIYVLIKLSLLKAE